MYRKRVLIVVITTLCNVITSWVATTPTQVVLAFSRNNALVFILLTYGYLWWFPNTGPVRSSS